MKKVTSIALILALFLLPTALFAATFNANENATLRADESINSNYYTVGGNVTLSGAMRQDLTAAGGNILITGGVDKDATVAGGNIQITGRIGEDLRAAGGTVNVSGKVVGDAVLAGGQVFVISSSTIGGDLAVAGGRVVVDAPVKGMVKIGAGEVVINGVMDGEVTLISEKITIGDKAVINGTLSYHSSRDAQISPAAKVNGTITKLPALGRFDRDAARRGFAGAAAVVYLLRFVMVTIAGLFIGLIWKKLSTTLVHESANDLGWNILRGLVFAIVTPIIAILLLVTVFGVPLGILTWLMYITAMIIAGIFSGILAGHLLYKFGFNKNDATLNWHTIVVGNIVLYVVMLIPVVGWIIAALLCLTVFGEFWRIVKRTIEHRV